MSIGFLKDIKLKLGADESKLFELAKKELGVTPSYFRIVKKSLDARKKSDIRWVYSIEFSDKPKNNTPKSVKIPKNKLPDNPIIVIGSGPAGLFVGVKLIDYGFSPIIVERGDSVDEREKKCNRFFLSGQLDNDSNVQFGEGGAGTFSDGKLNTQTHSPKIIEVLSTFVKFGAPKEIEYLSKPHIGSDNLKKVVKNMREYIQKNGGKVLFNTRLTDIKIANGEVVEVWLDDGKNRSVIQPADVVLAIGHSARDTFEMLFNRGVIMTQKNFAVGVRIEHLQEKIGFSQYGEGYKMLPPADYKLVSHASLRPTFTFCMCPGGVVIPSASEEGGVVTNGMSNYSRNEKNANSALIVAVKSEDFGSDHPLAGVEFQRRLEKNAFIYGGGEYKAPTSRVEDFLSNRKSTAFGEVTPSYLRGVSFAPMQKVLPEFIVNPLKSAIVDLDKKLKGFAHPDAILTAVESRTSSPVRIERNDNLTSKSASNLYPCGEGAGYAGGITSSSVDGLRVAEQIFIKYFV